MLEDYNWYIRIELTSTLTKGYGKGPAPGGAIYYMPINDIWNDFDACPCDNTTCDVGYRRAQATAAQVAATNDIMQKMVAAKQLVAQKAAAKKALAGKLATAKKVDLSRISAAKKKSGVKRLGVKTSPAVTSPGAGASVIKSPVTTKVTKVVTNKVTKVPVVQVMQAAPVIVPGVTSKAKDGKTA